MVLDDQQTRLRIALLGYSVFLAIEVLLWLALLFGSLPLTPAQVVGQVVVTSYFLFMWAWVLLQRHRWRRVNARRQAIAAGQERREWLAPPVLPRPQRALAEPMTIALKPAWRGTLALWGLTLAVLAAIAWPIGVPPAILFGGLIVLTLILLGANLALARWPEQKVEVRREGLIVKGLFKSTQAIYWKEPEIFVRWSWSGREGSVQLYELANSTTILRWRVLPRQEWWHTNQPVESWETYAAQTAALRAWVEAATGLPLYDVG